MSQQHSKSCLAEYQGECVAETCCGKLIQFPRSPINRLGSREWHKKAYEFSAAEFESSFADEEKR